MKALPESRWDVAMTDGPRSSNENSFASWAVAIVLVSTKAMRVVRSFMASGVSGLGGGSDLKITCCLGKSISWRICRILLISLI